MTGRKMWDFPNSSTTTTTVKHTNNTERIQSESDIEADRQTEAVSSVHACLFTKYSGDAEVELQQHNITQEKKDAFRKYSSITIPYIHSSSVTSITATKQLTQLRWNDKYHERHWQEKKSERTQLRRSVRGRLLQCTIRGWWKLWLVSDARWSTHEKSREH